jgi:hypothetical protein
MYSFPFEANAFTIEMEKHNSQKYFKIKKHAKMDEQRSSDVPYK